MSLSVDGAPPPSPEALADEHPPADVLDSQVDPPQAAARRPEPDDEEDDRTPDQKRIGELVVEVLRSIYDPEIPVNIYDLGLIYAIYVDPETFAVSVDMTLTAPACPVAESLPPMVASKIEGLSEVPTAKVELVWEPAWDRTMMSEAAQLELGMV